MEAEPTFCAEDVQLQNELESGVNALNVWNFLEQQGEVPESTEVIPPSADRAYFGSKTLSASEKRIVVVSGQLQPLGPFPKQTEGPNKGRSFH